MQKIPQAYELYRHFSGKLYQVLAMAKEAQSGDMLVIYQALYGDYQIYAGDYTWFTGMTLKGEGGNDCVQRFMAIENVSQSPLKPTDTVHSQTAATIPKTAATTLQTAPVIPQKERLTVESVSATSPKSDPITSQSDSIIPQSDAIKQQAAPLPIETDEIELDPLLIEFLDSDTYEAKLNILSALHHRITDGMITTMAVSCDIEVDEGDVEERYASLRNCLLTMEKYECNRLRNR
jgi:hypothetical protein